MRPTRPRTNGPASASRSALRSRPARVSYKEPSSGDESEETYMDAGDAVAESSGAVHSRPSRNTLALRPVPRGVQSEQRQRRRTTRNIDYAEGSSDDLDFNEEEPNASNEVTASTTKRRLLSPDSVPTPSPKTPRSARKTPARRAQAHDYNHRVPKLSVVSNVPSDGNIPPWQELPYEILLSIFRFALSPAHDDEFKPTSNVNWLVRASCICRAFSEPALAALYESPPLLYRDQPHDFVDVLDKPDTYLNYKLKVKRLELDAKRTLAYSHPGRGHVDVGALVSRLPNLSVLDISSGLDRPPYRQSNQRGKWHYPENLFDSLVETGIRLKEWRWAGNMIGRTFPGFQELHLNSAFRSLKRLTLSHLWLQAGHNTPGKGTPVLVPSDLSSLGNLENLTLLGCHSDGWEILQGLPNELTELAVIKCPTFDTKALHPFLVERGRKLNSLILSHNHALDLTWLVDLKPSCPRLRVLRMDLTYFSTALLTQNADAEPIFEALMLPEEVPTWPSSLEELEMLNLRKWSPDAAVTFFESLVSSHDQLPRLKRLVIKAMIDISWRERASFREKWIGTFTQTFLRRSPPPNPHLASFRASREWKAALEQLSKDQKEKEEAAKSDSDRRVTRSSLAEQQSGSTADLVGPELHQGSCEVVEISIDNMRPTEVRLSEANFIDSEISGDEEWTEGRSSPAQTSYAW